MFENLRSANRVSGQGSGHDPDLTANPDFGTFERFAPKRRRPLDYHGKSALRITAVAENAVRDRRNSRLSDHQGAKTFLEAYLTAQ